jgi:outer membrane protein OmpA-like peptidoglycan-associated protein
MRGSFTVCAFAFVLPLSAARAQEAAPPPASPAPAASGETRSFVACPLYRDTDMGRKSGCWLGTDVASRTRYDVTWAPIKPQVGKPILVEGVVTAEADTCGGVVLKPVRVSVLDGSCPILQVAAEEYPGRPSPPPVEVLAPASVPRELPPPPYERRDFSIYFEFGRDFLIYQHSEVVLERIQLYTKASQATQLIIHGFAATEPQLVSRRRIAEPLALAETRAKMVEEALVRLGVPRDRLTLEWSGAPAPTDLEGGKLPESSKRRVVVTVVPGAPAFPPQP